MVESTAHNERPAGRLRLANLIRRSLDSGTLHERRQADKLLYLREKRDA
jgi:hypothetical protein